MLTGIISAIGVGAYAFGCGLVAGETRGETGQTSWKKAVAWPVEGVKVVGGLAVAHAKRGTTIARAATKVAVDEVGERAFGAGASIRRRLSRQAVPAAVILGTIGSAAICSAAVLPGVDLAISSSEDAVDLFPVDQSESFYGSDEATSEDLPEAPPVEGGEGEDENQL